MLALLLSREICYQLTDVPDDFEAVTLEEILRLQWDRDGVPCCPVGRNKS